MDGILAWGVDVVRAVQTLEHPALTVLMKAITFLGSEYAYLAMLPLVYWCVDERKGVRLGVVVLVSAWLNSTLKVLWKQPRPYDLDPSVALDREKTFGLPSGHAQGSVTFWGVVGSWLRAPVGVAVAILVPLAVSFTRVYLGVHFPTDIFAGWALGLAVLAAYFIFGQRAAAFLAAAAPRIRLMAAAAAALLMNALHPQDVSLGGVLFGMGTGYVAMRERFPFEAALGADGAPAGIGVRAARYALGIAGTGALYLGLKLAFPGEGSSQYAVFRFARYAAIGLWVSAGAPWLFLRLKLAGRPRAAVSPSS